MDKEGKEFILERGVRQGDPISPKLFISVLEDVFQKLETENGINIDGKKLQNLRFADDIILIATTAQELNESIQQLVKLSKEVGLEMNPNKTKLMTNSTEAIITINNNILQYVQDYIYLGQTISFENATHKEIRRRTSAAWAKFWSLKFILMNRTYSMKIKRYVMNSCILPTLLYGSQTWSLTGNDRRILGTCQRKMERKILNINLRDRVRNEDIRKITGVRDVTNTASSTKWKWAGHIMRMDYNRWAHRSTAWDPRTGSRNVGRQKKRWADDLKQQLGNNWSTKAKERATWREITKAAARHE